MRLFIRFRNFLKIKFGAWIDNTSFKKNFNIKDTIGIFGPARSGTTWLMELLLNIPEYTSIFEPFHPNWFPETVLNGFTPKPILNPENGERLERYLERAFTGKVKVWFPLFDLTFNNAIRRLNAQKIIVKSIRANWILPLITQKFDLRSVIFITRHPYAVIASQVKTGYTGYTRDDGDNYDPQKKEIVRALESLLPEEVEIYKLIQQTDDKIELLTVNWALDNIIPLTQMRPDSFHFIAYENLFNDPANELRGLLSKLNEEKYLDVMLSKIEKLSISTRAKDMENMKNRFNIINQWKKLLSNDDIIKIQNILEKFDIEVNDETYKIGAYGYTPIHKD